MGTELRFSIAYHPQSDGQTERVNQIMEDILRTCALQYGDSWDTNLPYAEFSYNNIYQTSLKITPFEALYGRKCRTPLFWNQTEERQVFGPDSLRIAKEKVQFIRQILKAAQSRQKSYADVRRRELVFQVGDYVYLKVSLMRVLKRFIVKGKLAPRYVGPFKILERKREVAYQLELHASLSNVRNVFHVSQFKKCLIVPEEQLPLEKLDLQDHLTYEESPMKVFETAERITQSKTITMCKVQWKHHFEKEATWKKEDDLISKYPQLFSGSS